MRRPLTLLPALALLAALALVGVGLLVLMRIGSGPPAEAPARPAPPEAAEAAEAQAAHEAALPFQPRAPAHAASGGERVVLRGRVVDIRAAPLAGLRVTLTSSAQAWLAGEDTPRERLPDGAEAEGFATTSGVDGRFELDVPAPSAVTTELAIAPRPPLAGLVLEFGEGWSAAAPLLPGVRDLGDLVVPRQGTIEGRVVSAEGAPLAGAVVTAPDVLVRGAHASARTDAVGAFALHGLPPLRPLDLRARADGYVEAHAAQVEIPASGIARGARLVLQRGEAVRGRVLDERDAGVAGVELEVSGGAPPSHAHARSTADGAFEVRLPPGAAPLVSLTDERYEQVALEHGPEILVRVRAKPRMAFAVVDAATGAPIERFGLALGSDDQVDQNLGDDATPPLEIHPGGTVVRTLVLRHSAVRVVAPGHADADLSVQPDEAGVERQTIRMRPESAITGRVVLDGAGLSGATVRVERGRRHPDSTQPVPASVAEMWQADLRDHAGRARRTLSGADGAFRIAGLPAGSWRLAVEAPGAAPFTRDSILLAEASVHDAGVLELARGGAIRGVVRVPPDVSPIGMRIDALGPTQRGLHVAREDGAIEFGGLEPGEYALQAQPGVHLRAMAETVGTRVIPGRVSEVVFDFAGRSVCRARIALVSGGRPLAGARVFAHWSEGVTGGLPSTVGVTDESGEVALLAPGAHRVRFSARSAHDLPLGTSAELLLPASGELRVPVELAAGTHALELPAALRIPARARVSVLLVRERPLHTQAASFLVTARAGPAERSWGGFPSQGPLRLLDGPRAALGPIEAGDWSAQVWVHGRDQPAPGDPPLLFEWKGTLVVLPGRESVLRPQP